jgi:hypothetical protein
MPRIDTLYTIKFETLSADGHEMTSVAEKSKRTDEQKACRKLIIRNGIRLGQRGGIVLMVAVVALGLGFRFEGAARALAFLAAGLIALAAAPFMIMGKRLAHQSSRVLAAIDDPSLVLAIHVEGKAKVKNRYMFAIRYRDNSADHVLLPETEFAVMRTYFAAALPELVVTQSDNAARTIRLALS